MAYKAAFKRIIKTHVTPIMIGAGFQNKGATYRLVTAAGVVQRFELEGSRRNSADSFSFTGNISFMRLTPTLASAENQRTWLDDEPEAWLFGERLGYLTHGRDHWYAMEDVAEEDLVALLKGHVSELLIPLFARCVTVETVLALKQAAAASQDAAQRMAMQREFARPASDVDN